MSAPPSGCRRCSRLGSPCGRRSRVSSCWLGVPTPGFALAEVLAPEFALAQVLAHEFPLAEVPTPWLRLRRTHQCRCIRFQRHRLDTETSEIDRVGRRTHAAELLEHHQTRHGVSVHSQAPHCASASRSYDLRERKKTSFCRLTLSLTLLVPKPSMLTVRNDRPRARPSSSQNDGPRLLSGSKQHSISPTPFTTGSR